MCCFWMLAFLVDGRSLGYHLEEMEWPRDREVMQEEDVYPKELAAHMRKRIPLELHFRHYLLHIDLHFCNHTAAQVPVIWIWRHTCFVTFECRNEHAPVHTFSIQRALMNREWIFVFSLFSLFLSFLCVCVWGNLRITVFFLLSFRVRWLIFSHVWWLWRWRRNGRDWLASERIVSGLYGIKMYIHTANNVPSIVCLERILKANKWNRSALSGKWVARTHCACTTPVAVPITTHICNQSRSGISLHTRSSLVPPSVSIPCTHPILRLLNSASAFSVGAEKCGRWWISYSDRYKKNQYMRSESHYYIGFGTTMLGILFKHPHNLQLLASIWFRVCAASHSIARGFVLCWNQFSANEKPLFSFFIIISTESMLAVNIQAKLVDLICSFKATTRWWCVSGFVTLRSRLGRRWHTHTLTHTSHMHQTITDHSGLPTKP